MRWHKTSDYSIACEDYAVSRATCLDTATGELVDQFSAWYGIALGDAPRGYFPELLGVRRAADEAKALCATHRCRSGFSPAEAASQGPPPGALEYRASLST